MDQMAEYYENMGEKYDPTLTLRNFKLPNLSHLEDRNVNSVGATASTEIPRESALSKYSLAFANVKAISCTAVEPASRI